MITYMIVFGFGFLAGKLFFDVECDCDEEWLDGFRSGERHE